MGRLKRICRMQRLERLGKLGRVAHDLPVAEDDRAACVGRDVLIVCNEDNGYAALLVELADAGISLQRALGVLR